MHRSLLLPIVTLAILAFAVAASGTQAARSIVLSEGHADAFQPKLEDDELVLYFHDDTASQLGSVDPADVLMLVNPEAELSVPDSPAYGFLGSAGESVWILPQTSQPGLMWPGLSTESLDGEWEGNQVELSLVTFSGPGAFHLYEIGSLLEVNVLWRSDSLGSSSFPIPIDLHAHMNWAFSEPGLYTLGVQVCGNHTGPGDPLGDVCSDVEPYAVEVLAEESAADPTATATTNPTTSPSPTPIATGSAPTVTPAATVTPLAGAETTPAAPPDVSSPNAEVAGVTPPATGDSGIAELDRRGFGVLVVIPAALVMAAAAILRWRRRGIT